MMKYGVILVALFLGASCAQLKIEGLGKATYLYEHDGVTLEGELHLPKQKGKRPAVIVVHAWKGPNQKTSDVAKRLSEMGYVALVADVYGQGIRPKTTEEASERATYYRQRRPLMRARLQAAFDELSRHPKVDPENISALGFCFGGGAVLELARSGADLSAAISFHGNLDTPNLEDAQNIQGRVLVLHGAVDPYVPQSQVEIFMKEMEQASVDYTLVSFGGGVHSFTDPNAGDDPSTGVAYDPLMAERAYQLAFMWLGE